MYYVIGDPKKPSLPQTHYRSNYNGVKSLRIAKPKYDKKCRKKREILVHLPDKEIYHEPYMLSLQQEYLEAVIECTSKIELPWRDIALPRTEIKIRQKVEVPVRIKSLSGRSFDSITKEVTNIEEEKELKETMDLPWEDLIISDVVETDLSQKCMASLHDSSLEIPWDDLAFGETEQILPLSEPKKCLRDGVEIPWEIIMIPKNIYIESKIKHKYPSTNSKRRRDDNRSNDICSFNCKCDDNKKKMRSPIAVPTEKPSRKVSNLWDLINRRPS